MATSPSLGVIRLTSFAVFKSALSHPLAINDVDILTGASEVRIGSGRNIELVLASNPMHTENLAVSSPKNALLMQYGLRDSMDELYRMRGEARRVGARFACVHFELDVGKIEAGLVDREMLRASTGMRFLNFQRMKASLKSEILDKFQRWSAQQGLGLNNESSQLSQISGRPDLWDRLCEDDQDFRKLDVLVIPVSDYPAARVRNLAYVRPGVKIVSETQSDMMLMLPDWMKIPRKDTVPVTIPVECPAVRPRRRQ